MQRLQRRVRVRYEAPVVTTRVAAPPTAASTPARRRHRFLPERSRPSRHRPVSIPVIAPAVAAPAPLQLPNPGAAGGEPGKPGEYSIRASRPGSTCGPSASVHAPPGIGSGRRRRTAGHRRGDSASARAGGSAPDPVDFGRGVGCSSAASPRLRLGR